MYDTGKVIAGLVAFLAIATSPILYQWAKDTPPEPPKLNISPDHRTCVAPTEYMRSLHMDLLNDWRNEAVRDGDRTYVAFDGKLYEKSLAVTCLGECHSNKQEFCDRCHEYVGAEPYCWNCHVPSYVHAATEIGGERFTRFADVK